MSDTSETPQQKLIREAKARRAQAHQEATEKAQSETKLALAVGKSFVRDDGLEIKVLEFFPDHLVRTVRGPAYKIVGSNPNRHDVILCEELTADYKEKE